MPMPLPHIEMHDPRVLALAKWRQQLSHEGVYNPTWEELTDQEREDSLPEARNYLKAAIRAGLIPAGSPVVSPLAVDGNTVAPPIQVASAVVNPGVKARKVVPPAQPVDES
ncbi:hypothetical protein [Streptomyces sp. BE133]|uniref:hypothetical protein n=1 Tax=Streptomyces sp. BE133 TaxID=3002523 RepID=UPI002E75DF05|nr:hypothetical protein [Streptomyces sp. BE133]MEE1812690.1 hypothetical protein [Streptomyces sp. BE133]